MVEKFIDVFGSLFGLLVKLLLCNRKTLYLETARKIKYGKDRITQKEYGIAGLHTSTRLVANIIQSLKNLFRSNLIEKFVLRKYMKEKKEVGLIEEMEQELSLKWDDYSVCHNNSVKNYHKSNPSIGKKTH